MENSNSSTSENLIFTPTAEQLSLICYDFYDRGKINFIDTMIDSIEASDIKKYENFKQYKNIQVNRKCRNITEFLSKHGDDLYKIRNDYNVVDYVYYKKYTKIDFLEKYGSRKYYNDLLKLPNLKVIELKKFKYVKEFQSENDMNYKIFQIITDVLYCDVEKNERRKIIERFCYLNKRQFKYDYFYLDHHNDKNKLYCITKIFKWIKKVIKGKNGDNEYKKIFECESEYLEEEENIEIKNFNCCICYDDKEYKKILKNCNCVNHICNGCYSNIPNPKVCPTCRQSNFQSCHIMEFIVSKKRIFNYKYNNKLFKLSYNLDQLSDDTIYLFNNGKLEEMKFTIQSYSCLRDEFIQNLQDHIIYFNPQFLYNYFNLSIPERLFNKMMEAIRENNDDDYESDLMELLGLSDDYLDEVNINFCNHCYNEDGTTIFHFDEEPNKEILIKSNEYQDDGSYYEKHFLFLEFMNYPENLSHNQKMNFFNNLFNSD